MSAARRLGNEFVLAHMPAATNLVLDFGSGDGHLAQLLRPHHRVVEHDRRTYDQYDHGLPLPFEDGHFDVMISHWSLSVNITKPPHNDSAMAQVEIAKELARCTQPGGRLIVVTSFSPKETREQWDRTDPQAILCERDHARVRDAFGSTLIVRYFFYEHGGDNRGEWCEASQANATAYVVIKGRAP